MLLNLIIFKFIAVFEDINNRLVNILSQKNLKYQKHSFVIIYHTSGPRNRNLIDVRKNEVLSSGTQARDLLRFQLTTGEPAVVFQGNGSKSRCHER